MLLTVILVLVNLALLTGLYLLTITLYNKRDDLSQTPIDVYTGLLGDTTAASVARTLSKPSYGDIGTFGGYDWDYQAGKGGGLQVDNPVELSLLKSGEYIPPLYEGRPNIIGLT